MAIEFAVALNDGSGRAAIAYHAGGAAHELQRHGVPSVEIRLDGRAPFSGFGAAKRLAKLLSESDVDEFASALRSTVASARHMPVSLTKFALGAATRR